MNSSNSPLITIITVSYNVSNTIEQTILSVINQNFSDFEYIIIDGGSTDSTVEIIKKYQEKITLWVSERDGGIYDAMNKGVNLAKGKWINFMNAGDSFYNLNIFNSVFSVDRKSDVIYGDNMLCYDWGKILLAPDDLSNMNKYMTFGHQTVFMIRELLIKYPFDCSFKIAADYNLFYTVYKENYVFEYVPICISLFSATDGVSTNTPISTYIEDSRINGNDKIYNWHFCTYMFKMRLKIRKLILFLLPTKFVEQKKKKNILKNKLIKEVILNV